MSGHDSLRRNELMILQKEDIAIKQMIEKYYNALNRLQVEELTLRSQLGRIQDVELKSRTTTPLEEGKRETPNSGDPAQTTGDGPNKILRRDIVMNELQINQTTLNLDAAPLIHRMLHDSEVYEEEEEEEEEDESDN